MTTYTLEEKARIVWTGALEGRQAAREGYVSASFARMERLDRVAQNANIPSLCRIARDAAVDIENLLVRQGLVG